LESTTASSEFASADVSVVPEVILPELSGPSALLAWLTPSTLKVPVEKLDL
jgi:hypothetical protein